MRVIVVGAGLAGLFTASELSHSGVDVTVVEASAEPGGITRTIERDGFSLEPGAGSFNLPHPHLSPILSRAGAQVAPARRAVARHVYSKGRLVGLTPSPGALLAPVLDWRAKFRALGELVIDRGDPEIEESLDSFCRRRFGEGAGELAAWLMATGVYAGDPRALSAAAAFPMMTSLESEHGSVMRGALRARLGRSPSPDRPTAHVPVGGMSGLADALTSSIRGRFLADFPVESLSREAGGWVVHGPETLQADELVLAVRPKVAARIAGGELGELLTESATAPVAVIWLGGAGEPPHPQGFGALVGPGEELATLGILFESSYAPARAPKNSWLTKVIAGGATRPEVVRWDRDVLVEVVSREAGQVLGKSVFPTFVEVVRHHPGIPQYQIGHRRWLDVVRDLVNRHPGLHLTGWGYRGIGVAALATDAARVAAKITG